MTKCRVTRRTFAMRNSARCRVGMHASAIKAVKVGSEHG